MRRQGQFFNSLSSETTISTQLENTPQTLLLSILAVKILCPGVNNACKRRRGSNFLRESGAPAAIPTRDLPLRSEMQPLNAINDLWKALTKVRRTHWSN